MRKKAAQRVSTNAVGGSARSAMQGRMRRTILAMTYDAVNPKRTRTYPQPCPHPPLGKDTLLDAFSLKKTWVSDPFNIAEGQKRNHISQDFRLSRSFG
jgi:hypothetical protein